jgi:DNA-binding PadR family transcriptional regulator
MNDLMILSFLLAGPQHGYAMKKQAGAFSGQPDMHNNLVYPLLKRFVSNGWVSKRSTAGHRGQTRDVYALTVKGKKELMRRLGEFTKKEAASENEFRLRVGLFMALDKATRLRILNERDSWLEAREQRFAMLEEKVDLGEWGGEVVRFLRESARAERVWIASLKRKVDRNFRKSLDS